MDEKQPNQAPTVTESQRPLGELLSELLPPNDHSFFDRRRPMSPDSRRSCLADLVKAVGPRYARCTFENFDVHEKQVEGRPSQREVVDQIAAFTERLGPPDILSDVPGIEREPPPGLMLFGRPGTGKDHLMLAAAYTAILRFGLRVQWENGSKLYQDIRRGIADNEPEYKLITRYTEPYILMLSDPVPPRGDTSPYAMDVLYRVIDRRYRDLKPTWSTLNVHDGEEAERRMASSVVDRLRHNALCVECNWDSYRRSGHG